MPAPGSRPCGDEQVVETTFLKIFRIIMITIRMMVINIELTENSHQPGRTARTDKFPKQLELRGEHKYCHFCQPSQSSSLSSNLTKEHLEIFLGALEKCSIFIASPRILYSFGSFEFESIIRNLFKFSEISRGFYSQ